MNTLLKRALAVAAVKKGYDVIQERRRPKHSKVAIGLPLLALLGAAGYAAFRAYGARQSGPVSTGTAPELTESASEIRLEDTLVGTNR
jgi:hypothetical protein